jgi:hypothetical protein
MDSYVGMTPTVVIGLGGTGKEIMIKIRRMIVETYGSLEALPIVSFLHIDTEQNAKVSEAQTVLKQDISLRPQEQIWAKVEDAKAILNKLSAYNYLEDWFPPQLKGTDSILAGAGQIRALGKLAFTLNYQTIKTYFNNAKTRIQGHEKFMLDMCSSIKALTCLSSALCLGAPAPACCWIWPITCEIGFPPLIFPKPPAIWCYLGLFRA